MGKKMSGSNSTGPTKAGKKHSYKDPAPASPEKRAARLQGEQQFVRPKSGNTSSNRSIQQLGPDYNPFHALCRAYGVGVKGRNSDHGYRYDETRKRVIVPEGEFTNGY